MTGVWGVVDVQDIDSCEESPVCSVCGRERQALERFRDSHFTDRITYRQSVKLIRNLEFRASSAQLYIYVWRTPW